jgi:hypothetical protein
MPKLFGKQVSPIMLVAVVGVVAYGVVLVAFPEEQASSSAVSRLASRNQTTARANNSAYTEEDYKVRFVSASEPVRNAFRPLVIRQQGGMSGNLVPGGIPADFAGGDGNWVVTGVVEFGGTRQALLENRSSGDGDFVERGQRWKNSTIVEITATSMTLLGPGGRRHTLLLGEITEPSASVNVSASVGPVTVSPGMIGQPAGVQGVNVQPTTVAPGTPTGQDRRQPDRSRGRGQADWQNSDIDWDNFDWNNLEGSRE